MPPESLTLIERYGSFGLLCIIVLSLMVGIAAALRFVKNDLIPRAFDYLEKKDADHAAQLAKKDADHAAHLETRDAAQQEAMGKVAGALDKVCERLEKVEDRVDGMAREQVRGKG